MFSGGLRGGFGQPGQRSFSVQSMLTEVWIAVTQCVVGIVAWLLLAFVVQRVVVVNIGDAVLNTSPEAFPVVVAVQTFVWRALCLSALLVHLGGLGVAMAANVLNPNWPPPFAAQNAVDVVFPRYLRWLLGMGWMRREPSAQQVAMNLQRVDPGDIVIHGDIMLHSADGHQHWPWKFDLKRSDLDKLREYFDNCLKNDLPVYVSVRDLQPVFGKGGNDRRVAKQLRSKGVIREEEGRVIASDEVVEWILARRYAAQESER